MKKHLLFLLFFGIISSSVFSQSGKYWTVTKESKDNISKDKAVARQSFPVIFQLYNLEIEPLKQALYTVTDNRVRHSTIISLPNADGQMEDFEVFEASNFEPDLQARFPEIRAFSGKGITDRSATLKMSLSPQGIQTMVFRVEKENEFIEPYSADHTVYAVFRSNRKQGQLPWTCSTVDTRLANELNNQVFQSYRPETSTGELITMRLAQSCNGEYSNYFGATSSAQVALVLAAFNATLTRCNGIYERDLALHLNLIASATNVIYYNPSTDPYTTLSSWNSQLQSTLTSVIGEANYDIGHMFGASGGGGNAGCIGCVCVNGSKGSGITSPADGIPQGDNFDIDYVAHEVGHQLGANHTFSHSLEGTGVNKEVGSGITIMGYAGITTRDVAPHSIDHFHQASIAQIQTNLNGKTCPVKTSLAGTNATPVVAAVSNYTIPISTPFALTGSATDSNPANVLTYCWEQNDNSTTSGASSVASATKATGPNWISFSPTTSPTRLFPKLSTILSGALISGPLTGGDAGANSEALSSVSRTLNFRLTVRDNAPYSSTAPVSVGQTNFTDMVVTVSNTSGPFSVTSPNTAVTWAGGSTQNITWNVTNTTAAPVSCANVKISLSTDGGNTFPTVLIASTPNDGTEALVIPNIATTTARIKIEAVGNIFFDISNANFTITSASTLTSISTSAVSPTTYCAGASVSVPFTTNASANAGNVFTAQLSNASGSFASPVSIGTLTSTSAGTISATIPAGTTAGTGYRIRVVSSNPVVTGTDNGSNISINVLPTASTISAGSATTFCQGGSVVLSGNVGGTWSTGATSASITVTSSGTYFVTNTNSCGSVQSNSIAVIVNPLPAVSFTGLSSSYTVTAASVSLSGTPAGGTFSGPGVSGSTFSPATAGVGGPYSITYSFTNANGCSASTTQQTTVTAACTVPKQPGSITTVGGSAKVCPGDVKTYSIAAVTGATSYTWIPPVGAIIGSGQGTVSVTIIYTSAFLVTDTIKVAANNSCGSSLVRFLKITRNAAPSTPSVITGLAFGVCNSSSVSYSVTNIAGLTYNWAWDNAGATVTGGHGTNAITSSFTNSFVSGKLSVTATNTCGTSSARTLTVYGRPATPGAITGATSVCAGQTGVPYSIAPVPNASSYIWYVPSGARISDGTTTSTGTNLTTTSTNITVNFSSTAGQVRVKGVNACAAGSLSALTVGFVACKESGNPIVNDVKTGSKTVNILVYPNPAVDVATIKLPEFVENAVVTVIDMYGQTVMNRMNFSGNKIDINSSVLAKGNYIVRISDNKHFYVGKFMKQ